MEIIAYPSPRADKRIQAVIDRGLEIKPKDYETVTQILSEVKTRGDEALVDYTNRFDAPNLTLRDLKVTDAEMRAAAEQAAPDFLFSLDRAVEQIEAFHKRQVGNSWMITPRPGVLLGQLLRPVEAAGVYVPGARGGTTPLVSSVLMGVIPARIAGVKEIYIACIHGHPAH